MMMLVEYKGETLPLSEWARRIGISYDTLRARINRRGWSVEEAFETPAMQNSNSSRTPQIVRCVNCGKEFEQVNARTMYCSKKCREETKRLQSKRWREIRRIGEEAEKRKTGKNSELSRIARLATEAGMTYGQYVAKMEKEG